MSLNNVQTAYSFNPVVAIEGSQGNYSITDITTRVAEAIVPYGRAVVRGTTDRGILLPTLSTQEFLGISLAIFGVENPYSPPPGSPLQQTQYNQYDQATVVRKGYVYMYTETNVLPGDPVYYRYSANGGNTVLGRVRNANDAGHTNLMPNATFEQTALAGTFVLVRLDN